jgi:hypothetical protein
MEVRVDFPASDIPSFEAKALLAAVLGSSSTRAQRGLSALRESVKDDADNGSRPDLILRSARSARLEG